MPSGRTASTVLSDLVEILDASGKPLCLITPGQALRQGLCFRTVAVQIATPKGTLLLSETATHHYEITCMAPLPAGKSLEEFACVLQADCLGTHARPTLLGRLAPDQIYLFYAVHSEALLKAMAPPGFLQSTRAEIARLADYDIIGPMLTRSLPLLP